MLLGLVVVLQILMLGDLMNTRTLMLQWVAKDFRVVEQMMLFHLLLISKAEYAVVSIYVCHLCHICCTQASDGLYDDLPEGTYDNSVFGGAGRSPGMVYDNPQGLRGKRTPMTGTEGGVYDNPNALGQVQQGGLYDNPKVVLFVCVSSYISRRRLYVQARSSFRHPLCEEDGYKQRKRMAHGLAKLYFSTQ